MQDMPSELPAGLPDWLREPIQNAEADLRKLMSRFSGQVRFEWGYEPRAEKSRVTLTLSLDGQGRTTGFYDTVFKDPVLTGRLLRQLWSGVLADQFDHLWQSSASALEPVGSG